MDIYPLHLWYFVSEVAEEQEGTYIAQLPLPVPMSRMCWTLHERADIPSKLDLELTLGESPIGARCKGFGWW